MRSPLLLCALVGCDYVIGLQDRPDAASSDVASDVAIDARFDPTGCPPGYIALPGLPNSKYSFVLADDVFPSHDSRCRLDGAVTHLVLIETQAEGFAIDMHLDGLSLQNYFWVGARQQPEAMAVAEGWSWLSGRPVDPVLWGQSEPGDGAEAVENHEEDCAMMGRFGTGMDLIDAPCGDRHHAICECDGVLVR